MEKRTLMDIPSEYFGRFRINDEGKGFFWIIMLGYITLLPICVIGYFDRNWTVSWIVSLAILCLVLLMILPAVFFSFNKTVSRFRKAFIICKIIYADILCLMLMNLLIGANAENAKYLHHDGYNDVIVYVIGGVIYVQHIVLSFLFWSRIKKCILKGSYLPGGTGFWNKRMLPVIGLVAVVMPALSSLIFRISRHSCADSISITATKPLLMLEALIIFLIAGAIAGAFAFINANLIGRYNYVKIHGCDEDSKSVETDEEGKSEFSD